VCKIIYLEDVGEVSEGEDVVELGGRGQEDLRGPGMEGERRVYHRGNDLVHRRRELVVGAGHMLLQDGQVDRLERLLARKTHSEHGKVTQQAWVDGEAARRRIHARHVLRVVDVPKGQLRPVVPVAVVHVLPQNSVRLHCPVRVHLNNELRMK